MLSGVVIDGTVVFNDKLREWEDSCDFNRPHGSLGGADSLRTTRTDPGPDVTSLRTCTA
jgi:hypothetical protein